MAPGGQVQLCQKSLWLVVIGFVVAEDSLAVISFLFPAVIANLSWRKLLSILHKKFGIAIMHIQYQWHLSN